MNTTTVQTPAELESTQMIFAKWMQEACKDAELVEVTRKHTPFGSFVVAVERIS